MKSKVDDVDVDKLKTVSVDLKKLSDVVDRNVLKKNHKQGLDAKIEDFENKIPDVSRLVTNIAFDTKIGEVESKILNVSELITNIISDTKNGEVEGKTLDHGQYTTTTNKASSKQRLC